MPRIKVRVRLWMVFDEVVRDQAHVSMAHDKLAQHLDTVALVGFYHEWMICKFDGGMRRGWGVVVLMERFAEEILGNVAGD